MHITQLCTVGCVSLYPWLCDSAVLSDNCGETKNGSVSGLLGTN